MTDAETAEQDVRRSSDAEVDAFLRRDSGAMARLWSDDMVVTNPLDKLVSRQAVLGLVESGVLVITEFVRQIEHLHVVGDVVFVAGSEDVVWGAKMPLAGKAQHLRFTAVWMQRDGRWQQVIRHANVVSSP